MDGGNTMPRQINGWRHVDHLTDSFELFKAEKLYKGIYGDESVKVIGNSYMGHWYADVYIKKGAKKKRELTAMFGSHMRFQER